ILYRSNPGYYGQKHFRDPISGHPDNIEWPFPSSLMSNNIFQGLHIRLHFWVLQLLLFCNKPLLNPGYSIYGNCKPHWYMDNAIFQQNEWLFWQNTQRCQAYGIAGKVMQWYLIYMPL